MPENGGSEAQKRTKIPFLCLGMVAASSAALPRALRGASGSSALGNRLPQPTTQPAAVALPPRNYRKKLPPCATAGTPTSRTTYLPCMLPQPAAKTYLPLILPCIPPDNLPAAHTTVQTAVKLPQKATAVALPPRNYRKKLPPCAAPGQPTCRAYYRAMSPTAQWLPRPAGG